MPDLSTNLLYYGDNLDILRRYIPSDAIDLIYLDPPFNSNRSYNVLFRESSGAASEAQIEAFEDTWHWGPVAARAYEEVVSGPQQTVARMLRAMVDGLGHNDVTAYLSMMAVRLVELHRVLKPTGSIYLHCDPTAGPYLRVLMDAIFGPMALRNEIIWKRTPFAGSSKARAQQLPRSHDMLLYYSKGHAWVWNAPTTPYLEQYLERFKWDDQDGRGSYRKTLLKTYSQETFERLKVEDRLIPPIKPGAKWSYKQYLSESSGTRQIDDVWTDINAINPVAKERLGYPTQKPLALLERIVNASSSPGDVVLDPFCGCGTAVHAAQKLGRRWLGIDVTHLAISLIRRRMQDAFPGLEVPVIGEPVDLAGARDLAAHDKYQFQWWALDRLGAQPVAGKKKGADRGIDGVIPFFAGSKEDYKRAIVSVKGGEHVTVAMVRDLVGVLDREKEPIGVLVALEPPTQPMITEAAAAGFYHADFWQKDYPRVQIITIEQLLAGVRPQLPSTRSPFAQAPLEREVAQQGRLGGA